MTFKKGQSGNLKGRPKDTGSYKYVRELQMKFEPGLLELFYQKAKDNAEFEGDISGLRDIYRDSARHRGQVIPVNLTGTLQEQIKAVGEAANEGMLTPNEVLSLMTSIEKQAKIYETTDMKEKLDWLMEKQLERDSGDAESEDGGCCGLTACD